MDVEKMSPVQKRQYYYFRGRAFVENGKLIDAIEAYKTYCTVLLTTDQHIPHLWISKLYDQVNEEMKSLEHLEMYAEGSIDLKAAEIYKMCGDRYLQAGQNEKALENYKRSLQRNPKSPVQSKIQSLDR